MDPNLAAALVALFVASLYAIGCWWLPWAKCLSCRGTGRHARDDGKVWRDCRRCRGTGRRLRVGRWIWNYFTDKQRRATR